MADRTRAEGRGPEHGDGTAELRISLGGTHTRRDDLDALHTWLSHAPTLQDARRQGRLSIGRRDSLTQTDAMSGELVQDIILIVSAEVARSVAEIAKSSVETWLRNRRRFAGDDENPRYTLEERTGEPESGPRRGTGRAAGPGTAADPAHPADPDGPDDPAGSGARGPNRPEDPPTGRPGRRNRPDGPNRPEEPPDRTGGDEPGEG
ncbi:MULTISPECIES: hypothetical protein [unclassified Streptomyces]|uniref:hypothetical protein n=1 Tax=unclassified Streptomyces TaxID=2593676 RepID=UPI00081B17BB|nr:MULTISPECIES: hypothetical protein [unclassified Streptomyces]MYQ51356.1 hypothetical protein [Streptomyces sp. SID4941]SCD59162.1 hypothetical protein GA0115247_108346 [Streptomyces sp. PalvLS-984]SDD07361.1 hypothetical protein F558DRAFT_03233 [Streptomyces sp. AmelKG-A3]